MTEALLRAMREQLATQQAELATLRDDHAALRAQLARAPRRQLRHRLVRTLPSLTVALLVALVPLSVLATNPFTDLNAGSVHNPNIDAIFNAGITTGCDPGVAYCPNAFVTREEMASFLARTAGLGSNPPVANALTAQTAVNATNAQTAANATQLGGSRPARTCTRAATWSSDSHH